MLSYLDDLKEAAVSGRNLFTEKYARMMQSTSPDEYARIEHLLPTVDLRVLELIEKIVTIVLKWEYELLEKYSYIVKRRRPISSDGDSPGITSLETYLKGELATYSPQTLELYWERVKQQESNGVNGSAIILAQTLKQYGFDSLDEANERLKAR